MTLLSKYKTCVCYCWSSCCSDISNLHRISTCIVCLRLCSHSVTAVEPQDTLSSKSCFRCWFQEQEKTQKEEVFISKLHFRVLCLELGFPSLHRRADVDLHSEMDAVRDRPGGAACRLEPEQCPTGTCKGKEGEERGASTAAVRGAATTGTQRAGRPEPTVKAQGVWHEQPS